MTDGRFSLRILSPQHGTRAGHDAAEPRTLWLHGDPERPFTMGSSPQVDLAFPVTAGVARRHCGISYEGAGRFLLHDFGSTNGTFLNGRRIHREPLQDGDAFHIGGVALEFYLGHAHLPKPAPEPRDEPSPPADARPEPRHERIGGVLGFLRDVVVAIGMLYTYFMPWEEPEGEVGFYDVVWGYSLNCFWLGLVAWGAGLFAMRWTHSVALVGGAMLGLSFVLSAIAGVGFVRQREEWERPESPRRRSRLVFPFLWGCAIALVGAVVWVIAGNVVVAGRLVAILSVVALVAGLASWWLRRGRGRGGPGREG